MRLVRLSFLALLRRAARRSVPALAVAGAGPLPLIRTASRSAPRRAAGIAVLAGGLLAALAAAAPAQPSFDCGKAKGADEQAICADPVLADLDALLTRAYGGYVPSFQGKGAVGAQLLRDRRGCGADRACIAAVQSGALDTYTYSDNKVVPAAPAWVQAYAIALMGRKAAGLGAGSPSLPRGLPKEVGQCASTRIKALTTRFSPTITPENAEEGTAVEFDNGLHLISYERESALAGAAVGNRVVVCLMSIPHDCPKGDERGRLYLGLNLDTNTQIALPDSQHLCGGA
jgi:uncharacterized protein